MLMRGRCFHRYRELALWAGRGWLAEWRRDRWVEKYQQTGDEQTVTWLTPGIVRGLLNPIDNQAVKSGLSLRVFYSNCKYIATYFHNIRLQWITMTHLLCIIYFDIIHFLLWMLLLISLWLFRSNLVFEENKLDSAVERTSVCSRGSSLTLS